MTNLCQYLYHKCVNMRANAGSHFSKFGPFYLACIATPLVVVDILRHILVDNNIWTVNDRPSPAMYRPGCDSSTIACLSAIGWIMTVGCTYTGYALLVVATVWASNVVPRIRSLWRKYRASQARAAAAAGSHV